MKTRSILASILLAQAASVALLGQSTNSYSLNAVGYLNFTFNPGLTLFSLQLEASTNANDPAMLMDNSAGAYDGSQILAWTNSGFIKYVADHEASGAVNGWIEPDGPILMSPGVGAIFYNANAAFTFTLVGTIPQGEFVVPLNTGSNLVSVPVPASWSLSSQASFPNISQGQRDGDQAYFLYTAGSITGYTTYTANSLLYNPPKNLGWDGPAGTGEPFAPVGSAFWYVNRNQPVLWTNVFAVNQVVLPASGPRPTPLASPVVKTGHFQASVLGFPGKSYVIQTSPDLKTWRSTATNHPSSNRLVYIDPEPATQLARFYRALALP